LLQKFGTVLSIPEIDAPKHGAFKTGRKMTAKWQAHNLKREIKAQKLY